jgi:tetratricopeptide (TPR) repeat protein
MSSPDGPEGCVAAWRGWALRKGCAKDVMLAQEPELARFVPATRKKHRPEELQASTDFDPSPTPNTFTNLAIAYYLQGRYDDAITTAQSGVGRYSHHVSLYIALAVAYAEAGQLEAAARAADELRRLHPFFEVDAFGQFFRNPAEGDRLRASLRKAGL